jgi:hypothetical protein
MEKRKKKRDFLLTGPGGHFSPAECGRARACASRRPSRPTSGGWRGDGAVGAGPCASEEGENGVRGDDGGRRFAAGRTDR